MEKEKIFQQIKSELTEKEQMVLASMLDGDSVVDTAHNCGISVNYAQSYRKTIYEVVGQFVDYGSDKKAKQHILINFLDGYQMTTTPTEESQPEENVPGEVASAEEKTEISPAYQELFSYMLNQHDCILLESEMQEVYRIINDDLQNKNQELRSKILELENQLLKTQENSKKIKTPNYLVFNPKKGSPNKVYKTHAKAVFDAMDIAKKSQNPVFVLHIDSLVVPHCSFDVHDVSESGIPERYLNDEIPF